MLVTSVVNAVRSTGPFHSIEESPRAIFEPVAGSEWSKVHAEAQGRHSLKDVVAEMPPEVEKRKETHSAAARSLINPMRAGFVDRKWRKFSIEDFEPCYQIHRG